MKKTKISWIRWYLVNISDIHKPLLINKGFLTKKMALEYKDRYFKGEFYEPIIGEEAVRLNVKIGITPMSRKYDYGNGAWYSQMEKLVIRVRKRKKLYKMLRKDNPLTEKIVRGILENKPLLFIHRYKAFKENFEGFSKPIKSFKSAMETLTGKGEIEMLYPNNFNYISNIIRTLDEYKYDMSFYDKTEVALFIYKKWRRLILKYSFKEILLYGDERLDKVIIKGIIDEFKARGFIPKEDVVISDTDSYIETINLPEKLVYPRPFWHSAKDTDKNLYIYEAHRLYGLPGYCKACPAGLEKRK